MFTTGLRPERRPGFQPLDLIDHDVVTRLDAPILRELDQRGFIDGLVGLRLEHHQGAAAAFQVVVQRVDYLRHQRPGRPRNHHHRAIFGDLVLGDQVDFVDFVAFALQRVLELAEAAGAVVIVGIVLTFPGQETDRLGLGAGDLHDAVGDGLLTHIGDVGARTGLVTAVLDVSGVHHRDFVALSQFRMTVRVHQFVGNQRRLVGILLVKGFGFRIAARLDEAIELTGCLSALITSIDWGDRLKAFCAVKSNWRW